MTDNLRDRLIAVVAAASPVSRRFLAGDGYMSIAIRSDEEAAAIAVDAVIEELGLRIQVAGPDGIVGTGKYRYVTEWRNDE